MKAEIIRLLKECDGYLSGQQICDQFQVSRTAVWKVIEQLKKEGYQIEAVRNKGYHLEFVCENEAQAAQIQKVICSFEIDAKIVKRKKYHVVYLKESESLVDLLNIMNAHVSLMELESLRVEKEVRNFVNRQVNCEAANITKTVKAAGGQIEDILFLQKHYGLSNLPEPLRQMAEVRLEHPESSLAELGSYLNPPVGKSGVNHRLRKLGELARHVGGTDQS